MPDWKASLRERLAALRLRPERELEILDELSQHLDDRYGELVAGGTAPEEAQRLALAEIDEDGLLAREMRSLRQAGVPAPIAAGAPASRRGRWLADVRQDLVYAARALRQKPGFTAAAGVTLALGIGANSAIFSLVNATLLQQLPVAGLDGLDYVYNGERSLVSSYPSYVALRDAARLSDVAAWGGITASLNADGETDLVSGLIVTGNFFEVFPVRTAIGRLLGRQDDVTVMGHPVAVISHRLWQRRFAARPDIIGHRILMNGTAFTIVGVTPPAFPGPELGEVRDIYVPMMMQPLIRPPRASYSGEMNPNLLTNPNNGWLFHAVRRKAGVAPGAAAAELDAAMATYMRARGSSLPPRHIVLVPVTSGDPRERAQLRSVATLLTGVVAAVLLIACANVANLLLSNATARRREVAIRLALGASRGRIVRQLLTESLLLSALGGAAGVALAWLVLRAFDAAPPPPGAIPIEIAFGLDGRVLAFSLGLSLLTGLVFGVAPALQTSRPDVVPALKQETVQAGGPFRRVTLKSALVVAEVALSLLLLIAAGLFIRSLRAVQAVEPGYAVDQLVSTPLNVNLLRYTRAQGREFYRRTIERMADIPGVRSATVARVGVLTGGGRSTTVAVEGRPDSGNRSSSESRGLSAEGDTALANVVGPDFFTTLGIPLVRGRDFGTGDTEESPLVAIVSETMASRFFPGQDAIGKRFATGFSRTGNRLGDWIEIVGVARDSKYASLNEAPAPVVYLPIAQRHETGVVLYVRATGDLGAIAAQMRREIQAIEPNLPVTETQTMAETIATSLYAPRMGAILLAVFGGLALVLASLGIYGVLAFSIARRTREIGIRVALGASRRSVVRLVLREGLSLVAIGLGLGLAAGAFLAKTLDAFLFGVPAHDLATFAAVSIVLLGVAWVACYVPARRAVRVDPLTALRME